MLGDATCSVRSIIAGKCATTSNLTYVNSLFSLIRKCIFWSLPAVMFILATNVLPGLTTFVACCTKPTNKRISGDPLQYDLPCSTDPETDLLLKEYKDLFGTIPGFQGRPQWHHWDHSGHHLNSVSCFQKPLSVVQGQIPNSLVTYMCMNIV